MSDRKPTPTVSVITLNNEEEFGIAFSELGKTIVENFPRSDEPQVRAVLDELYETLALLSHRVLLNSPESERLAKFSELIVDYDEHLHLVGYEAHVEENLLVIGPVEP